MLYGSATSLSMSSPSCHRLKCTVELSTQGNLNHASYLMIIFPTGISNHFITGYILLHHRIGTFRYVLFKILCIFRHINWFTKWLQRGLQSDIYSFKIYFHTLPVSLSLCLVLLPPTRIHVRILLPTH